MIPKVKLRQNKEHLINTKHPWIYTDSLENANIEDGSWVHVTDSLGNVVASGSYSNNSIIRVRVFEFDDIEEPDTKWWISKLKETDSWRKKLGFGTKDTNGYRLIHGESDGVPGLVLDKYSDSFVIQSSTEFIDNQLVKISNAIAELFNPKLIYNKSDVESRRNEGLDEGTGVLFGEIPREIKFSENGLTFVSDPLHGQKTGFYLDQKVLRSTLSELSDFVKGKKVLNLFSYTASTSVYLLNAGAKSVHNVDLSERALDVAAINAELNNISLKEFSTEKADVFDWLEANQDNMFDIVLLDPPALIKGNKYRERGMKAYHYLNKLAMNIVKPNGLFVTSSCSRHLDRYEFEELIKKGSNQNNIHLNIVSYVEQAGDHPMSLYFPEGRYLKSYIFYRV